jgi:hypothetical protein
MMNVGKLPEGFSNLARDFVSEDFLEPEGEEPKLWHVTTARDKVLQEGLRSRRETGAEALGGGVGNQASDRVSVTFDEGHATVIADRMRLAIRAAKGKVKPSEVLDSLLSEVGFSDDTPYAIATELSAPEDTYEDWDVFNEWLDEEYGSDPYNLLQEADEALPRIYSGWTGFGLRVGFTADQARLAKLDEDQVAVLEIGARKGADVEHVPDEAELRFNPEDVWVITGPPKHFLELGGAARPRELWYRDLGAVPGEDYLFYPVSDPATADLEAAIGVIYEEQATPVSTIFYATIWGKPIRNQAERKDYFDTEEAAMDEVERLLSGKIGEHASEEDLLDIMRRSMEAQVARTTGEGTLLPDTEPRIILLSCGVCPGCKALEKLIEGYGIGRVIYSRSGEANELIRAVEQSSEPDEGEQVLLDVGHPILLANGEVQYQFAEHPPTEAVFEEWYELIYGKEPEAV